VRNLHSAAAVGTSSSLTCTSHYIITTGFCDSRTVRFSSRVLWIRASRRVTSRRLLGLENVGPEVRTASQMCTLAELAGMNVAKRPGKKKKAACA